jgi:hypothetical protein
MRRALEFLLTRVLKSRLGIALALAVVVFGIVGAARLVAGSDDPTSGLSNRPNQPITTVDPMAGDDGAISTPTPPYPITRPGALAPERIADRFVAAWLGEPGISTEQWHAGLRPLSTDALTKKLTGVTPAEVPVGRLTGSPTLRPLTEALVEVLIPFDTGQLRLELVSPHGQWLVDAVDWERQ